MSLGGFEPPFPVDDGCFALLNYLPMVLVGRVLSTTLPFKLGDQRSPLTTRVPLRSPLLLQPIVIVPLIAVKGEVVEHLDLLDGFRLGKG